MSEWRGLKLGEVCKTITDGSHFSPKDQVTNFRMASVKDLTRFGINYDSCRTISKSDFEVLISNGCSPQVGDVLIAKDGNSALDTVCVHTNEKPVVLLSSIAILRPGVSIESHFLRYYLDCSTTRAYLKDNFISGSAIPRMVLKDFRDADILLPSLPEQRAIAAVLSSLDDKIDLLYRQNKTLEAMAEAIFRKWFVEEADEAWDEKPLSFYGEIICGKTPSKNVSTYFNGNIPFIKIPDMHGNIFIFNTSDSLTEEGKLTQNKKTIPSLSICVSCIATVGLVSFTTTESQTNQQINSIVPKQCFYRYFLFLSMRASYDLLQSMASGGTATLNLNTGDFSNITLPYPGEDRLIKFQSEIEAYYEKMLLNSNQIRTFESLRDTLLPKLISGEVRVEI